MCKFLSAIKTRTGALYCNPLLDSHEDIIDYFGLNDGLMQHLVRLEFRPDERKDLVDIAKYKLIIDELDVPKWFDDEMKEKTISELTVIVKNLIVTEDRKILVGGAYIIASGNIKKLINCDIKYAGYATIEYAGYATIEDAGYATIEYAGYATIEDAGSATIEDAGSATIKYAGSATIEGKEYRDGKAL